MNLGNTDHRNCVIQLLFFNTEFREKFLSVDVASPVASSLQKLFARLEAGIRLIETSEFHRALAVNYMQPESIDEFLNTLLDLLHHQLAQTER
jgi:ubiquitin C-terminal hydrolase